MNIIEVLRPFDVLIPRKLEGPKSRSQSRLNKVYAAPELSLGMRYQVMAGKPRINGGKSPTSSPTPYSAASPNPTSDPLPFNQLITHPPAPALRVRGDTKPSSQPMPLQPRHETCNSWPSLLTPSPLQRWCSSTFSSPSLWVRRCP